MSDDICEKLVRFSKFKQCMSSDLEVEAGMAITSFDGRLGEIDYRGAVWVGHLVLDGSDKQIECAFDKERGEDAFNPFGNKRVSVTGRAIYAGDSKLPERLEVIRIEEMASVAEAIDIRGTMTGKSYFAWNGNDKIADEITRLREELDAAKRAAAAYEAWKFPEDIQALTVANERLREENERLREENDAWRMDGGSCAGEVKRLREENARLVDILDDVLAQWDGDWPEELYARVKAAIRDGGKEG